MIKGQDIVLLVKLITNRESRGWGQLKLSQHLCMSSSTVNASLRRLKESKLLVDSWGTIRNHLPVKANCKEFLPCVPYMFPAELSGETAGICTGLSPNGSCYVSPIYVWPDAEGNSRGMEFSPLYSSVPRSIRLYPDQPFYEMLCLIDVLRRRNVQEKNQARTQIIERIEECL